MNSPRHHRFVIRLVKFNIVAEHLHGTRSRPKFAHAQYKNSAVQKIMAFHAGGNTSCGRGMRNYHSTNSGLSDRAHCIRLEGRRFGTPESVGLLVWLVAVGGYKVESLAFQLPRSSKSARTYSFSSPLHLLVDPILLRTSYVASLAYQRFEGKREREQRQEVERDCQRRVRRPERSRQVPRTVGGAVNGSSLTSNVFNCCAHRKQVDSVIRRCMHVGRKYGTYSRVLVHIHG